VRFVRFLFPATPAGFFGGRRATRRFGFILFVISLIISTIKRDMVDNVNSQFDRASDEAFDLIYAIMHLFRSRQYRGLRNGPHEMTHMEGKLLDFFARNPGATLSDLVAHSARDKGQLARLIKSLKEAGFLRSRKDAEKDRRSIGLELTPAGNTVHKNLQRQRQRLTKLAVNGLDGESRRQLLALLKKVRANLEVL
jgi:DNA-binding MarR family transcriptional regulator